MATDADVPGLTEPSAGVRCMTTSPPSSFTAFAVGGFAFPLGFGAYGVYNFAVGSYVVGGILLFMSFFLGVGALLWSRGRTLNTFTTVFDNNSRTVSITTTSLLTPCCSNVETINYSAIQTICHESQLGKNKKLGSAERNIEAEIYFLHLASEGRRVPFRVRRHDSLKQKLPDEICVRVVARIADIINSAGFSVTAETRVNDPSDCC